MKALFSKNKSRTPSAKSQPHVDPPTTPDIHADAPKVTSPVPLAVSGGSHVPSRPQRVLLDDIGGLDRLVGMTSRFYSKFFQDKHIKEMVEDETEPHPERLATWIAEKMTGEQVWTPTRPRNARSQAHSRAWHSHKRPKQKVGRRFKLDDCRTWMRLMFWSAREEGLHEHKAFWEWYVQFIRHFIAVYEFTAPPFAVEDSEWSANPENIDKYLDDGRIMKDVIGVSARPMYYF